MTIQQLINALPREVAEHLAQHIIAQQPELLTAALAATTSVNYRVRVLITPEWRQPPANEPEEHFRKMLKEEVERDTALYEETILKTLQEFDVRRIDTLSNLAPNEDKS